MPCGDPWALKSRYKLVRTYLSKQYGTKYYCICVNVGRPDVIKEKENVGRPVPRRSYWATA